MAVSKETCVPDVLSKTLGDLLRIPGARAPGDWSRIYLQFVLMKRKNGRRVEKHFTTEPGNHLMLVNTILACNPLLFCSEIGIKNKLPVQIHTSNLELNHTFVPISWMCKKQTGVFHTSAESEIISLDAGLRLDGVAVVQFLECVLETLSCNTAKGKFERHKRDRVIPSHSHSDNCVFLSQLTMFRPTFPTALSQPNFTSSNTMRQ